MAITLDILRAWRAPRALIAEKLAAGEREERALAVLMAACGLLFVAQWPALSRAAYLDPKTPLDARLGGALVACLFFLPLIAYAMAWVSHLIAKAFGGRGSGYGARLALFWALLAVTPAMLLQGLLAGIVGASTGLTLVELLVFAGFLWIWLSMMKEVGQDRGL